MSEGLQVRDASRPLGGKSLDRLALLASPSRGLDSTSSLSTELSSQGSMDLTSSEVQQEFRDYISTRLNEKALPLLSNATGAALSVLSSARYLPSPAKTAVSAGEEELQQVLLLVRKLREALVASKRTDGFAVEVYELSAYLAVLCGDATQLAATLPRLVLELYPSGPTEERGSEDVIRLAKHLDLEHTTENRRVRVVSLYMLQTLCLSGRATRLGQYDSESGSVMEPLHRGLREYRSLRATLSSLYGSELDPHLSMCDTLYEALRDVDPFRFSRLVMGKEGYQMDGWQRLVLLQTVPALRSAAWAVARKSYMYLPISARVKGMIDGTGVQGEGGRERFLVELLLLNTDLLLAMSEVAAEPHTGKKHEEEPPEEWDADDQTSDAIGSRADSKGDLEEDTRLHAFLALQFGTTLPTRLMSIKEGHAVKIR
ncbi:hypothetical protein PSEUBRA_001792 [Kalmanozyma brasiliensis GHG001]|uniref:Uncharacterized protein n=1 Tax=Kalmanozyma brasiliensis (strain GHG001) TaxID=1365824 RepID=V5EE14_KALBG|nr:uncharacterized protein PSEUBRA_001792 [Kalmanozyma brasiliensis GHG001]EST08711.1 hypothetical protein PSEUBRA_001792 [Kalmanozyma brasiliensis GHG001]